MKNYYIVIFITLLFVSCKNEAKNNNLDNTKPAVENLQKQNPNEVAQILKEFYTKFYGSEMPLRDEQLLKKYVSLALINKINSLRQDDENLILDYDPFIQGQDYDNKTLLKTLEIKPLKKNDEYEVSFLQFGTENEKRATIIYQIFKEDGSYKINNIVSDEIINPQKNENLEKGYYTLNNADIVESGSKYSILIKEKNENKNKIQHTSNPLFILKDGKNHY